MCLTHIFCAGLTQVNVIDVDPENKKLYFAAEHVEVINTDGSGRKILISNPGFMTISLALDLKKR